MHRLEREKKYLGENKRLSIAEKGKKINWNANEKEAVKLKKISCAVTELWKQLLLQKAKVNMIWTFRGKILTRASDSLHFKKSFFSFKHARQVGSLKIRLYIEREKKTDSRNIHSE